MAAKNMEAIRKWVRENRPGLSREMDRILDSDKEQGPGMLSLLAIGFEAGRAFQKEHPNAPDGAEAY
ncbi:MAG: hypothetical protein WC460_04150 [Patescibacteria group bacterium]